MRIRVLIFAFALSGAALGQEDLASARRGDFGVRYWVSAGENKHSHNAQVLVPALGNPTSVLVYSDLDAHVLELFVRQNFAEGGFLKGIVGVGRITGGLFDDKDFEAGQVLTDHTTSPVREGRVGYGALDLGRQWALREGRLTLGVFAGFTQWTEDMDAYGATDHLGTIGPISPDTLIISNKVRWRALRLGVAGEVLIGSRARLSVDLALNPYAEVRNEDSHHLRADLGPVPNIILEGDGWGVQLDAELRYEIRRRTELGIGVRYWHMKIDDGTREVPNLPGFPQLPLTELYSTRVGVTLSLRRTW